MTRQFRDVTRRVEFGFAHRPAETPGKGDLAQYCAACPQPGVNMTEKWKEWIMAHGWIKDM